MLTSPQAETPQIACNSAKQLTVAPGQSTIAATFGPFERAALETGFSRQLKRKSQCTGFPYQSIFRCTAKLRRVL